MFLKVFIIVLSASFISNVAAQELTIPQDKEVIIFDGRIGNVTFAHKKHAELSITQCNTCHHKYLPADTVVKPCHDCHLHKTGKVPKTKKAFHARCIGCHEYTIAGGQPAGPIKKRCRLCHIKQKTQPAEK